MEIGMPMSRCVRFLARAIVVSVTFIGLFSSCSDGWLSGSQRKAAGKRSEALSVDPDLVISQVYVGGTGATLSHSYIELFNRGSIPVSLADRTLQYADGTSTAQIGA